MTPPADALRVTLDELQLPADAAHDRDYLVSLLRRLGYSEAEIERKLGGGEERTIEVEYSREETTEAPVPSEPAPAPAPRLPPAQLDEFDLVIPPGPATPGTSFTVKDPTDGYLDFSPPDDGLVHFRVRPPGHNEGQAEIGDYIYPIDYKLYYRDVELPSGRRRRIYFFSRTRPETGVPTNLPPGYEVCENKETGLPFLAKIGECEPEGRSVTGRGRHALDEGPEEPLGPFLYNGYTLFEQPDDEGRPLYFFAKKRPEGATPCGLPDGYDVRVNDRTGVPYLVPRAGPARKRTRVLLVRGKDRHDAEARAREQGLNVVGAVPVELEEDGAPVHGPEDWEGRPAAAPAAESHPAPVDSAPLVEAETAPAEDETWGSGEDVWADEESVWETDDEEDSK
ncbi:MAG: hypothetical protein ACPGQL_05235 [Thermoplasmatota archaeon]